MYSRGMGDVMPAVGGKGQAADGGFTPVMVRLTATEVETVDTPARPARPPPQPKISHDWRWKNVFITCGQRISAPPALA
jgi:hypothetical protein